MSTGGTAVKVLLTMFLLIVLMKWYLGVLTFSGIVRFCLVS